MKSITTIPYKPSKYIFTEYLNGFEITAPERNPVKIELMDYYFMVNGKVIGLYNYYDLSRYIAEQLMRDYVPPKLAKSKMEGVNDYVPHWIQAWAPRQTAKAIGKRVYANWLWLLNNVDPEVKAVQSAIFAATTHAADISAEPELYREKWLIKDIIAYRAAAAAAMDINKLIQRNWWNKSNIYTNRLATSPQGEALIKLANTMGIEVKIEALIDKGPDPWGSISTQRKLEALANWRGLYSPTGLPYRSLNRTLMNLPGGVPYGYLSALAEIDLPRPITNRLELNLILAYKEAWDNRNQSGNLLVLLYAQAPQIKEAMQRISESTHNELSPRRSRDIKFMAHFLADYPEKHAGNIVGLADKAIDWHRYEQEREIQKQVDELGAETKAATPPIPLPDQPGIRFLVTVDDICQEGSEMSHCLAGYSKDAVKGHCYLFHVEHNGERASVQVDFMGKVVQAHGPGNRRNNAEAWGKRVLKRWGAGFPADNLLQPRILQGVPGLQPGFDDGIPF
jgi:hypothetical protein